MQKKIDRRIQYTLMVLKESLMELLNDKPISSITIKELCALADINRSTFYHHFADQYDLLQNIEDEIIHELQQTLYEYDYREEQEMFHMTKYLLDYVASRSEHFRILFSTHGNKGFQQRVIQVTQSLILNNLQENHLLNDEKSANYITLFVVSGSIQVIETWLHNGMQETTTEMTNIIINITNNGLLHLSQ